MNSLESYVQRVMEILSQRYDDVTRVQEGKSGIVFSARTRNEPSNPIALKVAYPVEGENDLPDSVIRLRRECEIGAALQHEHILAIGELQQLDGIEFYKMQRASAFRLDHIVLQDDPPSLERIVAIMRELGDAIDFAHARGVVHGALRPSNVLLDDAGHVLLKGFLLREGERPPHPALAPGAVGDAAYMAPEQWREARVGRRVDVYTAGVLAYELCTGQRRVLYDVPGIPEIRPIELQPNRPLRQGIPLYVNAALRRATAKEAVGRFASVSELAKALASPDAALGHGLPTYAPPLKRVRARHLILLVLVLGALLATAFVYPSAPRDQVLQWGKSLLAWGAGEVDPIGGPSRPSTSTRTGGSSSARERGDATTRKESEVKAGPSRDSTSRSSETTARVESARPSPGEAETRRGDPSRTRVLSSQDVQREATPRGEASRGSAAQSPTTGILKITVDQGRPLVLVDGIPRGLAPVTVRVGPGAHRVSLRGTRSYDPSEMRLDVTVGDTAFAEFYAKDSLDSDTLPLGAGVEPARSVTLNRVSARSLVR